MATNTVKSPAMRTDANGSGVLAWEGPSDTLVSKQAMLVSNTVTLMTTPTGNITVPNVPISPLGRALDYSSNLTYNFGITVLDASTSATYYIGGVDLVNGTFTVYTTSALTTTVNSTNVKVTYFTLAPVEGVLNPDGTVTPNVNLQSNIIVPTDAQSRLQQTIQTHNAVSVATVSWSNGAWIDTNGFDRVAATMLNSSATQATLQFNWSNDGSTTHFTESVGGTTLYLGNEVPTKARYVSVQLYNANTASNTMSAWAYLKV